MTETVTIRKQIQTSPSVLTNDLNAVVKTLVQDSDMGTCSKLHGYILEVNDVNIISCSVSESNSFLNFDIDYTATTLKPKIGSIYTGRVCLVFEMGILVNIAEIMKVLIPTSSNTNFRFDSDLNRIEYKRSTVEDGSLIIENGDLLRIRITGIQFNESTISFNCYGVIESSSI
jgi:DNA-directed RNA polymerase subunit E'/Rpb7